MANYIASASQVQASGIIYQLVDQDFLYIASGVLLGVQSSGAIANCSGGMTVDNLGSLVSYGGLGAGKDLSSNTTITNEAGAHMTGWNQAVSVVGVFAITNYGSITGGIGIRTSGPGTIVNRGTLNGDQNGIVEASSGSTDVVTMLNYGVLSGGLMAYDALHSTATDRIVNFGTITGGSNGAVQLADGAGCRFDSSLGQVYGTIDAGDGGDVIIAGTNGGFVFGGAGNDTLRANPSQVAADNHVSFKLDGYVGSNALYGGGAFNDFVAGIGAGSHNQIHGGASLMNDVAGYANNTVDFSATSATHSVYVDLLNGHNAYVNSNASNTGTNTFEDSIRNVPNVIGSNGRDIIRADNTGDTIQGGNGADVIYAGTGADTFVYKTYYESHIDSGSARYDTISGFATGEDKVDLSAFASDPSHLAILNGSASTTLYLEATPGKFTASTDLAISFTGSNAIKASDVVF